MSRLVGTTVAGRFLGVTPRCVIKYCESGLIPPAAHEQLGPRGHHRIDLEQLHGLRRWLAQERERRAGGAPAGQGAGAEVHRCPTCGYGFIEEQR